MPPTARRPHLPRRCGLVLLALLLAVLGLPAVAVASPPDSLTPGELLHNGQKLNSPSGRYSLTMQTDGTLVLRSADRLVWQVVTSSASAQLLFGDSGSLTIRTADGSRVLWNSGQLGATDLTVTDTGQLDLHEGSALTWFVAASSLWTNETMRAGDVLVSPDHRFTLQLQSDGNVVVRNATRVIWTSNTSGHANARLVMQGDGNLVLYDTDNKAVFAAGGPSVGARLSMGNDGFAVVSSDRRLWSSTDDILRANDRLVGGDQLYSSDRVYRLVMQGLGNLVLYRNGAALWAVGAGNSPGAYAVMQGDGNLVLYSAAGRALFNSETSGHAGATLTLRTDGNAVVAAAGRALWSRVGGSVATQAAVVNAGTFGVNRGERVGVAVYDRLTGYVYTSGTANTYFASASVMKVFIATKLLATGQATNPTIAARMWSMITLSDDDAADYLYGITGGAAVATWAAARYHIGGVAVATNPYYWGLTRITAKAMVLYYNAISHDPKVGPWLMNAMAHMQTPAKDGWPQQFGIPSVTSGWRVKQGWMCCLDNRTRMHSTGFVNSDRYTVALLTEGSTGAYSAFGRDTVTGMAARLLPGGRIPH